MTAIKFIVLNLALIIIILFVMFWLVWRAEDDDHLDQ
jgi:hypothetical protein